MTDEQVETRLQGPAFERFRIALGDSAMNVKGLAIDAALSVLTGVEFYRDHSGYLCASRNERRVAGPNSTGSVTYWSVLSDAAHTLDEEAAARAGISQASLSNYETDKREMPSGVVVLLDEFYAEQEAK